jgi:hypothetical protein
MSPLLTALLLAAGSTHAGHHDFDPSRVPPEELPPLSPLLLCHVGQVEIDLDLYRLVQRYHYEEPDQNSTIRDGVFLDLEYMDFRVPGLGFGFPESFWEMLIVVDGEAASTPHLHEILEVTRLDPSFDKSRKAWGRAPKGHDACYDPDSSWDVDCKPNRDVYGELPEYGVKFWASWDDDSRDRLEGIAFWKLPEDMPGFRSACVDAEYPKAHVEDSLWQYVEHAFEDHAAVDKLFTRGGLSILDWLDLVDHHGFTWDADREAASGHGLTLYLDEAVRVVELPWDDGWAERALPGRERSGHCGWRYRGEGGLSVTVDRHESDRDGDGVAEPWIAVSSEESYALHWVREGGLEDFIQPPTCTSGDCQDGEGVFLYSDGCEFEGFFVAGVPTDGWYQDGGEVIDKIGDWQAVETVQAERQAAAQAVADAERLAQEEAAQAEWVGHVTGLMARQEAEQLGTHAQMAADLEQLVDTVITLIDIYEDLVRILGLAQSNLDAYLEEVHWAFAVTAGGYEKAETIIAMSGDIRERLGLVETVDCDELAAALEDLEAMGWKLDVPIRETGECMASPCEHDATTSMLEQHGEIVTELAGIGKRIDAAAQVCQVGE